MARATRCAIGSDLPDAAGDEEQQAAHAEVREHAVDPRRPEEVGDARGGALLKISAGTRPSPRRQQSAVGQDLESPDGEGGVAGEGQGRP